jgi:hypothetical protein
MRSTGSDSPGLDADVVQQAGKLGVAAHYPDGFRAVGHVRRIGHPQREMQLRISTISGLAAENLALDLTHRYFQQKHTDVPWKRKRTYTVYGRV